MLRTLAQRLDLPWPGWLTTENPWPDPPTSDERTDPAQVHAVLAAAFSQTLHLGEIADLLGWDTDRVHRAVDLLATRARPGGGTRLTSPPRQPLKIRDASTEECCRAYRRTLLAGTRATIVVHDAAGLHRLRRS